MRAAFLAYTYDCTTAGWKCRLNGCTVQRKESETETLPPETIVRLRERIRAFAASRYGADAAEDLAQEVLVVIHEKYGHVERLEELLPLALQILRFKMVAMRRKALRHGEQTQVSVEDLPLAAREPDPETVLAQKEMLERLSAGIAALGERCREMFRLKLEGRSFEEIRKSMGAATLNTVYTWDHRCRRRLLEWMGGSWEVERRER